MNKKTISSSTMAELAGTSWLCGNFLWNNSERVTPWDIIRKRWGLSDEGTADWCAVPCCLH